MRNRFLVSAALLILVALAALPLLQQRYRASAAPTIYASPIQAGCYIAAPGDCRLHVEPFTIYLGTSTKLVFFQLWSHPSDANASVIYDFKPDLSNPVPFSGSTFTPSLGRPGLRRYLRKNLLDQPAGARYRRPQRI